VIVIIHRSQSTLSHTVESAESVHETFMEVAESEQFESRPDQNKKEPERQLEQEER
jgi:hypothetical protein